MGTNSSISNDGIITNSVSLFLHIIGSLSLRMYLVLDQSKKFYLLESCTVSFFNSEINNEEEKGEEKTATITQRYKSFNIRRTTIK